MYPELSQWLRAPWHRQNMNGIATFFSRYPKSTKLLHDSCKWWCTNAPAIYIKIGKCSVWVESCVKVFWSHETSRGVWWGHFLHMHICMHAWMIFSFVFCSTHSMIICFVFVPHIPWDCVLSMLMCFLKYYNFIFYEHVWCLQITLWSVVRVGSS